MTDVIEVHETCKCGAYIKVRGQYIDGKIKAFHDQHKNCMLKPVQHVLSLTPPRSHP